MIKSEEIDQLATALAKAQGELKPATKNSENPHFKSRFADLSCIVEACRETLSKYGLSVTQLPYSSHEGKWKLVNVLMHSSGQWISSELPLKPEKDTNQGFGATLTYMRRYGYCPLVGIVIDEDDDGETADGRGKTKNQMPNRNDLVQPPVAPKVEPPKANNAPEVKTLEYIGPTEAHTLRLLFVQIDDESKQKFRDFIQRAYQSDEIEKIPKDRFMTCQTTLLNRIKFQQDAQRTNQG